jgi:NAD(P)-dependent dehydrogenase (short-subunit alcohol dehydrogenase family)
VTSEGFEQMFATNYLGPFLLTRLLFPYIEAGKPSRIINVTAPSTTRPDLEDLQGEGKFSSLNAFGASKAADLLFTYALARRLVGPAVTVNAYHPGIMKTGLNRTAPAPVRLLGGMMNLFAGKPPLVAAEDLVKLATSDEFAQTNGQLVHGGKPISAPFVDDKDLQERLWKVSCGLVRVEETL